MNEELKNWKLHQLDKETGELLNETNYYNTTLAQATLQFCEAYKCDLGDIHFTEITMNDKMRRAKERMINAIKNYISEYINNMTIFKYDNLDINEIMNEAIGYFDLNSDEYFELSTHCEQIINENYDKFYVRFENFSNEHKQLLQRMADAIMYNFAESVTVEQYDDQDEWIQFLQNVVCINWQEMQYINTLWTDEAKAKYRKQ